MGIREPLTPRNGARNGPLMSRAGSVESWNGSVEQERSKEITRNVVGARNVPVISRKSSVESWNGPLEQERTGKSWNGAMEPKERNTPQAIRERSKRFQDIKESRIPTSVAG